MNTENSPQYIIGIDIGTGSTKALALNYQGEIIANSQTFIQHRACRSVILNKTRK